MLVQCMRLNFVVELVYCCHFDEEPLPPDISALDIWLVYLSTIVAVAFAVAAAQLLDGPTAAKPIWPMDLVAYLANNRYLYHPENGIVSNNSFIFNCRKCFIPEYSRIHSRTPLHQMHYLTTDAHFPDPLILSVMRTNPQVGWIITKTKITKKYFFEQYWFA